MKKTLSVILAIVMLLSVMVAAVPVSAAAPIEATPFTGGTILNNNSSTATPTKVYPLGELTIADGIKLTSSKGEITTTEASAVSSNKVIAQYHFKDSPNAATGTFHSIPSDYKTNGVFMFYVKTNGANKILPQLQMQGNAGSYCESNTLKIGSTYSYAAKGADSWTEGTVVNTGTTVEARKNIFGLIEFDAAFEGYIKIPFSSLGTIGNAPTKANVGRIEVNFANVGGAHGEVTVGPFFYVNSDSESTKINVPNEFKPAPIEATPISTSSWTLTKNNTTIVNPSRAMPIGNIAAEGVLMQPANNGSFENANIADSQIYTKLIADELHSFGDATHIIMYVKLDAANVVLPMIETNAKSWNPAMTLRPGNTYYYAAKGADSWTAATAVVAKEGNTWFGGMQFDSAFEGYIKYAISDLRNDSVVSGVDKASHKIVNLTTKVKGLGGAYGSAVVGPYFLVTSDSTSTEIKVPDEFKPAPMDIVDFEESRVFTPSTLFSAKKVEKGYSLYIDDAVKSEEETKYVKGSTAKWSYIEEEDLRVGATGLTNLVFTPKLPLAPKDSQGFMAYLKIDSANQIAPAFEYERGTHWNPTSYNPIIMLKPGTTVSVCEAGSDKWVEKTVEIGWSNNSVIYGKISFDSAFEGYIKIPYSALNNDGGWKPYTTADKGAIDRLERVVFRFKGIGGSVENGLYGDVVTDILGYYTSDTPSTEIKMSEATYDSGDVNNDCFINATDLTELTKYLLGQAAEFDATAANINGDTEGKVDILDLIRLKKELAKA